MAQDIKELPAFKVNGFMLLGALLAIALAGGWSLWAGLQGHILDILNGNGSVALGGVGWVITGLFVITLAALPGFLSIEPNQAVVLVFLGKYVGTIRESGFWWTNPLTEKQTLSLRVRNFNSKIIKVNDAEGSPIEIAAVVVWQVLDSAKATFAVDDYEEFVAIQSETAIRALAIRYPYDSPDDATTPSLRGIPEEIARALQTELQERLDVTGVEVIEARLSHLAYAPEIAQVMLRRQQAKALIDARRQIVEGAVGMVHDALNRLGQQQLIELDDERKASMISNLLVVLTSEQTIQPVINTGTLYS